MENKKVNTRLASEIVSFQELWDGGFFEGNPLDPMAPSGYRAMGYMSVLHAAYLKCIKPFITERSTVLEIGPGRGAWTKTFVHAKEVWCLDALSAEHNGFWNYLGQQPQVRYFQVEDFSCSMLPKNHFDYLFSFGCLCHVSFEGITEYMENIYPKLKNGAECFIMIADYDKYNSALKNYDQISSFRALPTRLQGIGKLLNRAYRRWAANDIFKPQDRSEDNQVRPGRWYHAGIDRTCTMLEKLGYTVIEPDVGVIHRDPIIRFCK